MGWKGRISAGFMDLLVSHFSLRCELYFLLFWFIIRPIFILICVKFVSYEFSYPCTSRKIKTFVHIDLFPRCCFLCSGQYFNITPLGNNTRFFARFYLQQTKIKFHTTAHLPKKRFCQGREFQIRKYLVNIKIIFCQYCYPWKHFHSFTPFNLQTDQY